MVGYKFNINKFKQLLKSGIDNLKLTKNILYTFNSTTIPNGLLFLYDDPTFNIYCTYTENNGEVFVVSIEIIWPNILSDNYFLNVKCFDQKLADDLDWEELIVLKILYLLYKTSHEIDTRPSDTYDGIFRIQDQDELIAEIIYQQAL